MTTDPMMTLLPCPWCGGLASVEKVDGKVDPLRYSVGCAADEPLCMGYQSLTTFATEREAIAAWNRRATPSPQTAPGDVMSEDVLKAILSLSYSDVNRLYNYEIGEWLGIRFLKSNRARTWRRRTRSATPLR